MICTIVCFIQVVIMDWVQGNSPHDNHVALNAADGTKSQQLTYSYQNGLHTFSIPLKENVVKQKDVQTGLVHETKGKFTV